VAQSHKSLVLKVILMGNSYVGKTSILNKYVRNVFVESSKPTIGVDFANKAITKDDLKSRSTSCCEDGVGCSNKGLACKIGNSNTNHHHQGTTTNGGTSSNQNPVYN
jgi:hypothetical protein